MVDTTFMDNKYTMDELVGQFLNEIRNLKAIVQSPRDESKLQEYYQAVNIFKGVSTKELVQFALSFGRSSSAKASQMRSAFPTLLGNRIYQSSNIDIAYLKLLLAYSRAFKKKRANLKEWMLRFVIASRFSPLSNWVERELEQVISDTKQKISYFEQ